MMRYTEEIRKEINNVREQAKRARAFGSDVYDDMDLAMELDSLERELLESETLDSYVDDLLRSAVPGDDGQLAEMDMEWASALIALWSETAYIPFTASDLCDRWNKAIA